MIDLNLAFRHQHPFEYFASLFDKFQHILSVTLKIIHFVISLIMTEFRRILILFAIRGKSF